MRIQGLIEDKLTENPSCQNSGEGSKGYPKRTFSPFSGLPLLCGYWRNTVDKLNPLLTRVWLNNDVPNFIACFSREVEIRKFSFITDKVNIVSSNPLLSFLLQNHTTGRYPVIIVCFLAKVSTTYACMSRQFHGHAFEFICLLKNPALSQNIKPKEKRVIANPSKVGSKFGVGFITVKAPSNIAIPNPITKPPTVTNSILLMFDTQPPMPVIQQSRKGLSRYASISESASNPLTRFLKAVTNRLVGLCSPSLNRRNESSNSIVPPNTLANWASDMSRGILHGGRCKVFLMYSYAFILLAFKSLVSAITPPHKRFYALYHSVGGLK